MILIKMMKKMNNVKDLKFIDLELLLIVETTTISSNALILVPSFKMELESGFVLVLLLLRSLLFCFLKTTIIAAVHSINHNHN